MPYIAHAAIQLKQDPSAYEKNKWYHIKIVNDIEYRWRLNNILLCEVVAGVFDDRYEALKYAKQIYVSMLYSMLMSQTFIANAGCDYYEQRLFHEEYDSNYAEYHEKESFFFWNKHFSGGLIGPGVYEVEKYVDDFDSYRFLSATIRQLTPDKRFDFVNVDKYIFSYCREAQKLLSVVVLADQTSDYGMKMTIYCGLLEHLSIGGNKEDCMIAKIDELIKHVECSDLSKENKIHLKNFLYSGKRISSRRKCITLLERYAKKSYAAFTVKEIFDDAYGIRSKYSHGEVITNIKNEASQYMKFLILDVIREYFLEKEATNA